MTYEARLSQNIEEMRKKTKLLISIGQAKRKIRHGPTDHHPGSKHSVICSLHPWQITPTDKCSSAISRSII